MAVFRINRNSFDMLALSAVLLLQLASAESETLSPETPAVPDDRSTIPENRQNENSGALEIDPKGYVIYCPCMGQFGNQAEQFLGALGFAKELDRTIVLPPWRTYKNVPFDEWFKVEAVQQYHRAIAAETFMKALADKVWPEGKRIGFCWLPDTDPTEDYCGMKTGNPFAQFWDGLGVNFDKHIVYRFSYSDTDKWLIEYPGDKYPVIAMKGPPSSFPVQDKYVHLQQYMQWSEMVEDLADHYIEQNFPGEKFVGIHLRNGGDWVNVCKLTEPDGTTVLMSSPQCLGRTGANGLVTKDVCFPTNETILSQTKAIVESIGATLVYVATDKNPMIEDLQHTLGEKVRVIHHDPWLPQLDLNILAKSDHFIGNCVSSFTAFVARERNIKERPTSFWFISDEYYQV